MRTHSTDGRSCPSASTPNGRRNRSARIGGPSPDRNVRWFLTVLVAVGLVGTGCARSGSNGRYFTDEPVLVDAPADEPTVTTAATASAGVLPATKVRSATPSKPATTQSPAVSNSNGVPYLGPLTFRWKPNCLVPVHEAVTNGSNSAELTYGLRTVGEGENLVVSFVNMALSKWNGKPIPSKDAKEVKEAMAAFLLPSFVVAPDGSVVELRGMAETAAAIKATYSDKPADYPPELLEAAGTAVQGKYWESWAGFWAGLGSIEDAKIELTYESEAPSGGAPYNTAITIDSLGTNPNGQVRIREVQTLEGADFLTAIGTAFQTLGVNAAVDSGRRVTTVEVETDPATLQPSTASITVESVVTAKGETVAQTETRHWTMDWPNAGC